MAWLSISTLKRPSLIGTRAAVMSTRKRTGADLLVRVRYQNPLPPPPFPPKMLTLPTSLERFADYEYLRSFETDRELPLTTDAELGMPLMPGENQLAYWLGDRSVATAAMNPEQLDEDDTALLAEPSIVSESRIGSSSGVLNGIPNSARAPNNPAFLRKQTEKSQSDLSSQRAKTETKEEASRPANEVEDLTEEEQRQRRIQAIEDSFEAANCPLDKLVHPTVPSRRAMSHYPVMPDEAIWTNLYSLIRLPDDPRHKKMVGPNGEQGVSDQLTQTALLRPVQLPDDDPRVAYYLLGNEEEANEFRRKKWEKLKIDERIAGMEEAPTLSDNISMNFRCVRHYEATQIRPLVSEYMLTVDEGEILPESAEVDHAPLRPKGAYYMPLATYQTFKVQRPRRGEDPMNYGDAASNLGVIAWNGIDVNLGCSHQIMGEDELERRKDAAFVLRDPALAIR